MKAVATLPRPTPAYRWIALVLASLAMFGNYYAYDALNRMARVRDAFNADGRLSPGKLLPTAAGCGAEHKPHGAALPTVERSHPGRRAAL